MAIVEMSKIKLVAMSCYRENILNALQKTGLVDLSSVEFTGEDCAFKKDENLASKYDRLERSIDFLIEQIDKAKSKPYFSNDSMLAYKNFAVSYDEFINADKTEEQVFDRINELKEIGDALADLRAQRIKLGNLLTQLEPYRSVKGRFSDFNDTKNAKVFFGTVKGEHLNSLNQYFDQAEYTHFSYINSGSLTVVLVVSLNENSREALVKLNECGFNKCPFDFFLTPEQKISQTQKEVVEIENKIEDLTKKAYGYHVYLKDIKVLTDYYKFLLEKENESCKFSYTASTFQLTGYLPKESTEKVEKAVKGVSEAVFMEFSEPDEDELPPTLTKNDKLVHQTEFVTDMYSTPSYREIDPNKVVFFFFMLFMGVIMADIGYGLVMIAFGLLLSSKIKVDNGPKKLWNVIALGGVFAIIFGVLFNSFFGFAVLPFNIMPSPVPQAGETSDNLMLILLFCLLLGVIQMMVGYFCKALNAFKAKDVLGGIFEGIVWVLFFIGFLLAGTNFLLGYLMSDSFVLNPSIKAFLEKAQTPGLILVAATLLVATITAGRQEKGFGKFTKGFGKVYGLINVMSDILSYARLFGLMLSGMIIAQTFNDMGVGIIQGGGIGLIFGALVIVAGHVFNLAMGVLGAYIHDSRLQYIEFFNIFYTGEGNKFTPIGSNTKYIYITK